MILNKSWSKSLVYPFGFCIFLSAEGKKELTFSVSHKSPVLHPKLCNPKGSENQHSLPSLLAIKSDPSRRAAMHRLYLFCLNIHVLIRKLLMCLITEYCYRPARSDIYTLCYLLKKLNSFTLNPKLTLCKRLINEVEKLPWRVGDDISLEINSGQEKWRKSEQFSNPHGLALSYLLSCFLQDLGFHFQKHTKFPSSSKQQASAAETNQSLYQCGWKLQERLGR